MDNTFKLYYGSESDEFFMVKWSCLSTLIPHRTMTTYGEIQCNQGEVSGNTFLYSLDIKVFYNNKNIISAILRTYNGVTDGVATGYPHYKITINEDYDRELFTFEPTSVESVEYYSDEFTIDNMIESFNNLVILNYIGNSFPVTIDEVTIDDLYARLQALDVLPVDETAIPIPRGIG